MTITSLTKHDNHQVRIHLTKVGSPHYAALRCVECNTHIQWVSADEATKLQSYGVKVINRYKPLVSLDSLGI